MARRHKERPMEYSIGPATAQASHYCQPLPNAPFSICNLRAIIYNRLAVRADAAVVMLDPVAVVDIRDLHAIAWCHGVYNAPAADVERHVADPSMPAGALEEHQIARLQV